MKKLAPGALAGLAAAVLLAAPALAAPGNVGVRIEGDAQTLVPRTVVTTTDVPVGKPGQPTCAGTTALGALDKATAGDWMSTYDAQFSTYSTEMTVKGETHNSATSTYWAIWINDAYASAGLCGLQVQQGDELLFVPECWAAGCTPTSPLRLTGVPAKVVSGTPVTVKVDALVPPLWPETETKSAPAAGATITYGGATATTGADGTAQLTPAGSGPIGVQAQKAGHVRSATLESCVTTGSDGACGSSVPATPGAPPADDRTAPVARLSGIKNGATFSRKRAPRELKGTVSADPSGIKSVRLSILRKRKGRCWAFDGDAERFTRHRCGGSRSFRIGDRAEWSYLLPKRLPRGRYSIRVAAIDNAGNASATETRLRVR